MTLRRTIVLLALCAVAVAGYWGWQSWQLQQPGFHARDCWFGKTVTGAARCGFLVVRENRQMPESRTIRLPVVIFEAEKQADRKEPILYLTGGPGGSAYLGNQRQIDSWWAERRFLPPGHDFIVMAQRGTGLQELDIDCPELRGIEIALEARPQGEAPPDSRKLSIAAAQACAQRLVEEGVDLTAYNSRESAADIAELRRTLGIEEWTLYGVSYGTRLALSTLRYHPEGIRAVILDSVFPPEASWALGAASDFRQALEKDFTDCAEDPGCTQQYGDLSEVYPRAVEQLNAAAPSFPLTEIFGRHEQVFSVGGRMLNYAPAEISDQEDIVVTFDARLLNTILQNALLTKEGRNLIPVLIREAAEGRLPVLRAHLRDYLLSVPRKTLSPAVYLSHICRDETPFDNPEALERAREEAGELGYMITETWDRDQCEVWPAGYADPVENTAVQSMVPALLLAGSYDPLTPPSLAYSAAAQLPNGYVYELTEASHGALFGNDCAQSLLTEFLNQPLRAPAGDCQAGQLAEMPTR